MIGNVIASTRRLKSIRAKDLAKNLGIGVAYISQIENNKKHVCVKLLVKIAEQLSVSPSELLFQCIDHSGEDLKTFTKAKSLIDKILLQLDDK